MPFALKSERTGPAKRLFFTGKAVEGRKKRDYSQVLMLKEAFLSLKRTRISKKRCKFAGMKDYRENMLTSCSALFRAVSTRCRILFLLLFAVSGCIGLRAQENHKVLIITSFQVELDKYQVNLNEFYDEIHREHPQLEYTVENMNCRSLSELNQWPDRIGGIIAKHDNDRPLFVLLLGNEALASYLSLDNDFTRTVPCFAMLVNESIVHIPDEDVDTETWIPEIRTFTTEMKECNLKGAVAYRYDIDKNMKLATDLFPETKRINFLTDNTFGGITLLGLINNWISKNKNNFPIELRIIDGRNYTFKDAGNIYHDLDPKTDLAMFSTWRIDKSDNYFVISTTHKLLDYNDHIPGISISTTGIEDVSVGGYIPVYNTQGKEIGEMVNNWLRSKQAQKVNIVECQYTFDYRQLKKFNIAESQLPDGSEIRNKPLSYYEQNPVLFLLFCSVTVILILTVIFFQIHAYQKKRNIDELEKINAQLAEAKEQAVEADMMKSKFLANMSHEIRTPLNAIVGFSELIVTSHKELEEEELQTFSNLITQNTQLLLKLINDVLDFSRIETNKVRFNPENVELIDLANSLILTTESANSKDSVTLAFESPHEQLWYTVDKRYLQQVIINLLNNAIKFTDEGTVTLRIEKTGKIIKFSVTDTGIGIPLDKQELVFRRFEKLNEFKQGTGLGLSICQTIVEKMNGRIYVDPEYTAGARFVFELPIQTTPPGGSHKKPAESIL